jgi:hypothetical protein
MRVREVNTDEEDQFFSLQRGSLFSSREWASCYGSKLLKFFIEDENHNFVGGFIAYEGGKWGMKSLITPPYSPHIGLFEINPERNPSKQIGRQKKIMTAIGDYLRTGPYFFYKLDFAPEFRDMQSLVWSGIQVNVRYTYQIDLNQTVEKIIENFDPKIKNLISKSQREGHLFTTDVALKGSIELIKKNLVNKPSMHPEYLDNILRFLNRESVSLWANILYKEQHGAVAVCATYQDCVYYLFGAVDRLLNDNSMQTAALYQAIFTSKKNGFKTFDFEGSGIPAIEKFFRSFGGTLTPYFSITGGKRGFRYLFSGSRK